MTLLLTCATDFNQARPQDPLPVAWMKKATDTITKAKAKPWEQIKQDSMADVSSLMHRCDVDLGQSPADLRALPNDERLARFKGTQSDPDLMELYFQFGRYLLVSSSRPGSLPTNLQGIWADQLHNPWQSDYHLNINMQMNYWPVHTTGLSECHQPVFWMLNMLREEGRRMAASYGAKGFCTPHAVNPWGRAVSSARRPQWAGSLIAAPWQVMDVMEHHRFTGDTAFLRETGWPILKESCEFVQSWLIRDHKSGKWVPKAGASHEIGFSYQDADGKEQLSEIGPVTAYDQSIIWQIMTDSLEAATILGVDDDFTKIIESTLAELETPRIGKDGSILEWGVEQAVIVDSHPPPPIPSGGTASRFPNLRPQDAGVISSREKIAGEPRPRGRRPGAGRAMAGRWPGGPASMRATPTATPRSRRSTCWRPGRHLTFSAMTGASWIKTSASRRRWSGCCCKATTTPSSCCPPCHRRGRRDRSEAWWPAAASKRTSSGRAENSCTPPSGRGSVVHSTSAMTGKLVTTKRRKVSGSNSPRFVRIQRYAHHPAGGIKPPSPPPGLGS